MPVRAASFFIPGSPSIPFLLEDIYLRGGMRTVADIPARDALHPATIKQGCLVYTQSDGITWQKAVDGTWIEANLTGGGSVGTLPPLSVDPVSNSIQIDPSATVPSGGNTGDVLTLDTDGIPTWLPAASPSVGQRITRSYSAPSPINPNSTHDFTVDMGKTTLLLVVSVDVPLLKIQAFSTPFRTESNPYTFLSRPDQLFDDGSSVTQGGTIEYNRRYTIVSNLEQNPSTTMYWRFTNNGNLPVTPTLTLTFLIIE